VRRALSSTLLTCLAFAQEGPDDPEETEEEAYEIVGRETSRGVTPGRATSTVDRRDLEERLPRSAPDALRYEPGVYVQQTAHGQGSPFIRGRTGQQTLMLFDGVRLNNSTFRQGPNQYFFTIDSATIQRIEVVRGGASTRYGSDALGGAILTYPVEPSRPGSEAWPLRPSLAARGATAEREYGGRLQLDADLGDDVGLLVGLGARHAGLLRGGGVVRSPVTGEPPPVPRFEDDDRTQLGTGFDEVTADGRLVVDLGSRRRAVLAAYDYRQHDAPRTDQCPPAEAPADECLRYQEQFRTLAYGALEGGLGPAARKARLTLSWQRQHERRLRERPSSDIENLGRDDVHTLGAALTARSAGFVPAPWAGLRFDWGGDVYHDRISSSAFTSLTDIDFVQRETRGQYLDGSRHTTGGAFAEATVGIGARLLLRGGGRAGIAAANAPSDPDSGTLPVDDTWITPAGHGHVEVTVAPVLKLLAGFDRSFRAPNLDDLTSRQQTGPGFQFENASLRPETSNTLEAGVRIDSDWIEADLWGYRATVADAIARALRDAADCPPDTPECGASRSRFQLVNLDGISTVVGVEASARFWLPWRLGLRTGIAWARGDGPNPQEPPTDPSLPYQERVPLSRIPPLNGTAELRWRFLRGWYAGAALRWAREQTRLAPSDLSDARIPTGGTPGFAAFDLRAGYRHRWLMVSLVVENLGDAAYRYHGSSVNAPGRGLIAQVQGSLDGL